MLIIQLTDPSDSRQSTVTFDVETETDYCYPQYTLDSSIFVDYTTTPDQYGHINIDKICLESFVNIAEKAGYICNVDNVGEEW